MYHILFIYSCISGHLGGLVFCAIVNNVAINMSEHLSLEVPDFNF